MQAEAVRQAPVAQGSERGAHVGMEQHGVFPLLRVAHVSVVRRDVQVAAHGQRPVRPALRVKKLPHPGQPRPFVGVFLAAHDLAVRHVQADGADAGRFQRQEARLLVFGVAGQHARNRGRFGPRQDRYPVVRPLPARRDGVPQRFELGTRKDVVRDFRFLQADDVGQLPAGEPVQYARLAGTDGIHVPGDDAHGSLPRQEGGRGELSPVGRDRDSPAPTVRLLR